MVEFQKMKKVVSKGVENVVTEEGAVLMYAHSSNLDAFILMSASPNCPKFIFKKDLLISAFWVMLTAWGYGHIPINRSNREAAIKSLIAASKSISKTKNNDIKKKKLLHKALQ